MFEKYGEFDSAEEINAKAAELKVLGDRAALRELAMENGLDPEDAEDYADGIIEDDLCTVFMAAQGKIKVEMEAMKLTREFEMLADELQAEIQDLKLAAGVRRKGKSLAEYLAKVIDKGYQDAITPPKEILDKVTAVPKQYLQHLKTGMPNKAERKTIMTEYFGEKVV
jgi:hypothetical protein